MVEMMEFMLNIQLLTLFRWIKLLVLEGGIMEQESMSRDLPSA